MATLIDKLRAAANLNDVGVLPLNFVNAAGAADTEPLEGSVGTKQLAGVHETRGDSVLFDRELQLTGDFDRLLDCEVLVEAA